jgi:hypothetical protein
LKITDLLNRLEKRPYKLLNIIKGKMDNLVLLKKEGVLLKQVSHKESVNAFLDDAI